MLFKCLLVILVTVQVAYAATDCVVNIDSRLSNRNFSFTDANTLKWSLFPNGSLSIKYTTVARLGWAGIGFSPLGSTLMSNATIFVSHFYSDGVNHELGCLQTLQSVSNTGMPTNATVPPYAERTSVSRVNNELLIAEFTINTTQLSTWNPNGMKVLFATYYSTNTLGKPCPETSFPQHTSKVAMNLAFNVCPTTNAPSPTPGNNNGNNNGGNNNGGNNNGGNNNGGNNNGGNNNGGNSQGFCSNLPSTSNPNFNSNCSNSALLKNYSDDDAKCAAAECTCRNGTYANNTCSVAPSCTNLKCAAARYNCTYKLRQAILAQPECQGQWNLVNYTCSLSVCSTANNNQNLGCQDTVYNQACGIPEPVRCIPYRVPGNDPNVSAACQNTTGFKSYDNNTLACRKAECECRGGTLASNGRSCSVAANCSNLMCAKNSFACERVVQTALVTNHSECSNLQPWVDSQSCYHSVCEVNSCTDAQYDAQCAVVMPSNNSPQNQTPNNTTISSSAMGVVGNVVVALLLALAVLL